MKHKADQRRGRRHRRAHAALAESLESRLLLTTRYVDANAPAGGSGFSWAGASRDLQSVLTSASSGDTFRVADGTYRPGTGTTVTVTFQLKNGVTIQGGYAGFGAPNPDARDIAANPTILTGLLSTAGFTSYNATHVVTGSGTNSTAVLDGVTVTLGFTNNSVGSPMQGGGLYSSSGSPTISNCTFVNNYAQTFGGAVYNSNSTSTFTNCKFLDNDANSNGGGAIENVSASSPVFTNCTFARNSTIGPGGAIYNDATSAVTCTGCTFSANNAFGSGTGGAVYNAGGASKFTNCQFLGNLCSNGSGGAIYVTGTNGVTITQCLFDGNIAFTGGAISAASSAASTITNCTFIANRPLSSGHGEHGAAVYQNNAAGTTLVNSILYGNNGPDPGPIYLAAGAVNATYSDVQGGLAGTGNVNVDPIFANALGPNGVAGDSDDDLRLRPSAPVADAGNKTASGLTGITTDLAGAARFTDIPTASDTGVGTAPLVDMGAYEAAPGMVADAYGPYSVAAGASIPLKSYAYSDTPGSLSYAWDLDGDGQYDDAAVASPTFAAAAVISTTTIVIGLQVTDSANHIKTSSTTVKIVPALIYVDDSAPGAANGGSWTNAYRSLAAAMQDALPGTEIRIAQGTYKAADDNDPYKSLTLKNGQQLVGGYAGYGAAVPDARDVKAYPTIVSGDIGVSGDNADNTYRILVAIGVDSTTLIDGFTVTKGNNLLNTAGSGAALYAGGASPTVRNCTFTQNYGIGAAVILASSSSQVSNCVFTLNQASFGGAMRIIPTSSSFAPLTPAIPCRIVNCVFVANQASTGGAIWCDLSLPNISPLVIINGCTFSGNVADITNIGINGGRAIFVYTAPQGGAGPTVTNSIFWQNLSATNNCSTATITGSATISFCGGDISSGDFTGDPMFVRNPSRGADSLWGTADDDLGDVHLKSNSPAIDFGSNASIPAGITTDVAGNPRMIDIPGLHDPGAVVDIGAYERQLASSATGGGWDPVTGGVYFNFSNPVTPSTIQSADLGLTIQPSNQAINPPSTPSYDPAGKTATWVFNPLLADGNYRATLAASSVSDGNGDPLSAGNMFDFFILAGDVNHDRFVNTIDFTLLAANFNKSASYSQGDLNRDGTVNALDFNILASRFGATLPAGGESVPTGALAALAAPARVDLFASNPIRHDQDLLS